MDFLALVISSFVLGALHALEPGHGKAIVGAYLIGSKGTIRDAVILGIVVASTHSGIVVVLGILAMFAAEYFVTETVQLYMAIVSGVLIVGVGIWLIVTNFRRLAKKSNDHIHEHSQSHDHAHSHEHEYPHDKHYHHHDHGHSHDLVLKEGERPTLWQLVALGVSGGIVPCAGALVILLAAVTYVDFLRGIFLVIIFSAGLAATLVVIGILMVKAAQFMKGRMSESGWIMYIPMISACIITVVGIVLTVKAITDMSGGGTLHNH